MNTTLQLMAPVDRTVIRSLKAGDEIALSGEILVFRDQVHRKLCASLAAGEPLSFSLENQALYYCGPTPPRSGMPVGSAGPTTSSRMDQFTEPLLEQGLAVTIGKGNRSADVVDALRRHGAVYLAAVGGAGAYLAQHITGARVIAYPELGPEAARIFTIEEMPLIVAIDAAGASAYV